MNRYDKSIFGPAPARFTDNLERALSLEDIKVKRKVRPALILCICLVLVACTALGITIVQQLIGEWTEKYQDDPYWYPRGRSSSYGVQGQPIASDVTHEQVLEIALSAVMEQYDVDYDTLSEHYSVTTDFLDFDQAGIPDSWQGGDFPGHLRYWIVYISPVDFRTQVMDPYAVSIDAETGEILGIDVGYKG